MERLRNYLEYSAFGVCAYLGQRMGLRSSQVRLYFIYISCLTLGSPLLFYLFVAFWKNVGRYIRRGEDLSWR